MYKFKPPLDLAMNLFDALGTEDYLAEASGMPVAASIIPTPPET